MTFVEYCFETVMKIFYCTFHFYYKLKLGNRCTMVFLVSRFKCLMRFSLSAVNKFTIGVRVGMNLLVSWSGGLGGARAASGELGSGRQAKVEGRQVGPILYVFGPISRFSITDLVPASARSRR